MGHSLLWFQQTVPMRILVVDDTTSHCQMVARLLKRHGFEVFTAQDADEGMDLAVSVQPHLILMDVVMPGGNGFEATRRLATSSSTQHIPVILLSSKDKPLDRQWGLKQGARAYLAKPVQETELLRTLHKVLKQ